MRFIRPLVWLLAAVLLAGCSDSQEHELSQPDILSHFNAEGKAYLTLQIPLGSQTMTRAVQFADGSEDEYKVKDAYILMFAGASEATAKFASAYKVDNPPLANDANQQITRTVTITLSDANLNTGDKLFPFVVLNNNASAITSYDLTSVTFANGGSAVTLVGGSSTFSDLNSVTIADYKDDDGYFLMTNATLANGNTTSASLFHLPEIAASYFFPTEEQSRQNPAGHVNVDRLAVKTTVVSGLGTGTHTILGNEYATFEDGDLMFALDNYNTKSYAYRHLSAVSYSRFVETTAVEPYYPLVYRTYWGEDVNYDDGVTTDFTNYTNSTLSWKVMSASVYCAENTFDVGHMQDNCTTSVLVRLQLNKGEDPDHRGDFYTTSVTGQDIIFQPPVNSLEEQGTSASSSFSRTRSNEVTYDGTNKATIDDYLRTWLMQNSSNFRNWVNTYAAGEPKHVNIAVSKPTGGGTATVTGVTQTARTFNSNEAETFSTTYANIINNNVILKFYDDGYCYYRVPIRHFDDSQAPWNSAPGMTGNGTDQAYAYSSKGTAKGTAFTGTAEEIAEAQAQEYLGRYGVVRNNWYNISINSVTHIGSPIIPALTDDADDKVEQLLNATLQISGWEGHNQDL